MDIYRLSMDSGYTEFSFVLPEEKARFQEIVKDYFDELKSAKDVWQAPLMRSNEPKKESIFFEIDNSGLIAVNSDFFDFLCDFYKLDEIELLPIETDRGLYQVLNVLKVIDCVDLKNSIYSSTENGIFTSYSLLEFHESKLGQQIFKVPQFPYETFIDRQILFFCQNNNQYGLEFDRNSNLVYFPE